MSEQNRSKHVWPAHGGPQRWQDLQRGLVNRKQTIRQRNQQIITLKKEIEKLKAENAALLEALRHAVQSNHKLGAGGCSPCEFIWNELYQAAKSEWGGA